MAYLWSAIQIYKHFKDRADFYIDIGNIEVQKNSENDIIYWELAIVNRGEKKGMIKIMFEIESKDVEKMFLKMPMTIEAHKWINIEGNSSQNLKGKYVFVHKYNKLEFPIKLKIILRGFKKNLYAQTLFVEDDGRRYSTVGHKTIY